MYRKEKESSLKRFKMIQIHTTKNKRIIRALPEEREQVLAAHQEVKIPDEPHDSTKHYLHQLGLSSKEALQRINSLPDGFLDNLNESTLIDKDLLKEIRDTFDNESSDGNKYCAYLRDKLDNLYPFLK